uniref:hypothetical protein n=1 Tax=Roseinatronobacter sp. TaxID=1945755 RepID=UPI003F71BDBD
RDQRPLFLANYIYTSPARTIDLYQAKVATNGQCLVQKVTTKDAHDEAGIDQSGRTGRARSVSGASGRRSVRSLAALRHCTDQYRPCEPVQMRHEPVDSALAAGVAHQRRSRGLGARLLDHDQATIMRKCTPSKTIGTEFPMKDIDGCAPGAIT